MFHRTKQIKKLHHKYSGQIMKNEHMDRGYIALLLTQLFF